MIDDNSRRLAKAEHDRDRYKRRIRFLDSRHIVMCREIHALQTINRILITTVETLENVVSEYEHKEDEKSKTCKK